MRQMFFHDHTNENVPLDIRVIVPTRATFRQGAFPFFDFFIFYYK